MSRISGKHAGHNVGDDFDPLIVGVINLSPESFYKGSVANEQDKLSSKIEEMHQYGVKALDVGAISSRPQQIYGGEEAGRQEERERVKKYLSPLLEIAETYSLPVAIDTKSAEIAEIALDMGCTIVNDISGLKHDKDMATVIAEHNADIVLMSTKNKPGDVCGIEETIECLEESVNIALDSGIEKERIVIDPAFGGWQGRGSDCDLKLLDNFSRLRELELPIYIGVSRKSTINTLDGGKEPNDRLMGSVILTQWLVERGAHIIRTHDVKETVLGLNVAERLKEFS